MGVWRLAPTQMGVWGLYPHQNGGLRCPQRHLLYIAHAPLVGEAFSTDTQTVFVLLLSFLNENTEAESVVRTAAGADRNGRTAHQALCEKNEGVGMLANNVLEAESIVKNLFYT
eukprot:scaffold10581_cov63-Cylindrotheca_fusiformis.AAC.1